MHNDPSNLTAAVAAALGRRPRKSSCDDRLLLQKGCYILNKWGFGPFYRFNMFVRGPYSPDLGEDLGELKSIGSETEVPADRIYDLSQILKKGTRFVEAYTTIMLVKSNNPGVDNGAIFDKALSIKPHLKMELMEASLSLLV